MVVETRKSKASRPSPATSSQRETTKRSKLNNPVYHTGSEPGDEGLVINNHTPAGVATTLPKFPWAKLLSQYPGRPHCVITSDVLTVGLFRCDLVVQVNGLLCELKQMKESPSVATLEIKGTGVGPVVVNRKPYLKGTCVDLQGGDEVIFSTHWKHAYIFQPLKSENHSCWNYIASSATISEAHKHILQASVLNPQDIEFSLENFPYLLSDTTKDDLIKSTILRLKSGGKFANYSPKQSTISPRILLSGPAGSEIYRELLAKALVKHYGAKLMIVDTLFLPGESTSKEADSSKESDSRGSLAVLAEQAAPTSTTTSKSYTFKTGDRVEFVLSFSDMAFASHHLIELRGPKKGFKGKVILAFEDNESSKLGVIFDTPIADGNDLGGLCEIGYGFFCAASSLRLDSSSNGDADKLAVNEIFEVVSNESENTSLILMLKDIGKSVSGNNEVYLTLKGKLENLPKNTVVIASQTQLDSPEEKRHHPASLCHNPMPFYSQMMEPQYPELKPVKRITTLFPNLVTIRLPEDADSLMGCKKKVERDTETSKSQANITSIRAALSKNCLECPDLETLRITDQSLSTESADKVVDWALRHQLMSSSVVMNDDRIIISVESITHGLEMIQHKN